MLSSGRTDSSGYFGVTFRVVFVPDFFHSIFGMVVILSSSGFWNCPRFRGFMRPFRFYTDHPHRVPAGGASDCFGDTEAPFQGGGKPVRLLVSIIQREIGKVNRFSVFLIIL